MARAVGIEPSTGAQLPQNFTNFAYQSALFSKCIADVGADYIWEDGSLSKWKHTGAFSDNSDNLMWSVHLHDSYMRYRGARPMVLARFGGLGQHRYAIGFSGDAKSSWETLSAEIFMTSKASNVLFAHWSHDIGGFNGDPTAEMYARWAQFGIVSPIWRSHGTKGSERRYWQ